MSEGYGFREEILEKTGQSHVYEIFVEMFKTIPISAEINGGKLNKYLCMHGGISPQMQSKDDINAVDRFIEPQPGLVFDLIWADPFPDSECRNHSYGPNLTRDASYFFGLKPVTKLLCEQSYIAIIRAHEVCDNGFKMHGWVDGAPPQVYTIFSAPNYCGNEGNKGAIISIDDD